MIRPVAAVMMAASPVRIPGSVCHQLEPVCGLLSAIGVAPLYALFSSQPNDIVRSRRAAACMSERRQAMPPRRERAETIGDEHVICFAWSHLVCCRVKKNATADRP